MFQMKFKEEYKGKLNRDPSPTFIRGDINDQAFSSDISPTIKMEERLLKWKNVNASTNPNPRVQQPLSTTI